MYDRILSRIRESVNLAEYVVTKHAKVEMDEDDLTIYDLEQVKLSGRIIERQNDLISGESKYRIRGAILGGEVETIVKISSAGYPVIITVYCL